MNRTEKSSYRAPKTAQAAGVAGAVKRVFANYRLRREKRMGLWMAQIAEQYRSFK